MNFQDLDQLFRTQRAIRKFTEQPVADALVEQVLGAATRAPSARNVQPWRFIVVRNAGTKQALGQIFDELGTGMYGAGAPERTPWGEVPVLIAVCSEYAFGETESGIAALGASIYPAVQNLCLPRMHWGSERCSQLAGRREKPTCGRYSGSRIPWPCMR